MSNNVISLVDADAAPESLFIHLRVHSAFSLLEGAVPVPKLSRLCERHRMPAVAITDTNNLFGALEFSETLAAAGIQPIMGCTLAVEPAEDETKRRADHRLAERPQTIALLAKNETGYENLIKLSSRAFLETPAQESPRVRTDDLRELHEGLIALTGGPDGPINRLLAGGQIPAAEQALLQYVEIFGSDLYVELQRHGEPHENLAEGPLIELAYKLELPLVATNQVYFTDREAFEAHDVLVCIADGEVVTQDNRRRLTPEHYFKSSAEMQRLFADLPEAIANTVEIARRCAFRPKTRAPLLPSFIAAGDDPAGAKEREIAELRREAEAGLEKRLAELDELAAPVEDYRARLNYELGIIIDMDFAGYFLIVADFIKWANAEDIPVGPGRGSGAASVVAWALTITGLDPLRFGLVFERFLNPDRISMPDFDIDFCQDRRDEVIRYVQQHYGADQVAQIITFGKLKARAALRDVGRALGMPYGQVDRICKLVPNNPANPVTLAEALEAEPRLQAERDEDEMVARLLDVATQLEGLYRHASTHAAGVVIGDRPLDQLIPLYKDPRSDMTVTQFDMKWVEPAGLVKFDFLGLKTLTVIKHTCDLLKRRGIDLDIEHIPLVDDKTYEMLSRGETVGVFQFESSGMRDLLRQAKASNIEDLIALVALFRPGPMENIPKYLNCKQGKEDPEFLHEAAVPVLADTYGVIIYQEQVMQLAQVLSGYSLGEADILRRAMGKKKKEEMDAQRMRFVDGAMERDIEKQQANYIFDLIAKFAGYGFNKAHSAGYALVAYQTAYLKAHHLVEFLAANMTLDINNTDKLSPLREEAERMGVRVNAPDINRSEALFSVADGQINYALAAVRNVGQAAMDAFVEERGKNGPFETLDEFTNRMDPRQFNKRTLENLARAGAFDRLHANRRQIVESVDTLLAHANAAVSDRESQQNNLFGGSDNTAASSIPLKPVNDWPPAEQLTQEFDAVGFYLSGHPLEHALKTLARDRVITIAQLRAEPDSDSISRKMAGTVISKREQKSRRGNRFAFVGFSDPSGQFETVVFADLLAQSQDLLEPGNSVVLTVEGEKNGDDVKLRAQRITPVDEVIARIAPGMRVFIEEPEALMRIKEQLVAPGKGEVRLVLPAISGRHEVEIRLAGAYGVTSDIQSAVGAVAGVSAVEPI